MLWNIWFYLRAVSIDIVPHLHEKIMLETGKNKKNRGRLGGVLQPPPRVSLVPFKPNEKTNLAGAQRENIKTEILPVILLMAAGQR